MIPVSRAASAKSHGRRHLVRLAGNQVGGTEIHILDGRGENHVYGLVVSDFQTMRRYHPAEAYLAAQPLEIISATLLRIRSHEARQ